jgi:NAD(P)-dependent dehydrogenase (short-subunit alcohol dehydrogenase family)
MIIDLSGTRAIVTGSTAGIGFAIARGLAESGAAVVVNGRSQQRVDAAIAQLREEFPSARVEGIAGDLSTAAGVAAFLPKAGVADILVNNLGIFEPKPFDAIPDADWQRFFETNVMSGIRLSRHYLPGMVSRGWGRIVFISSESGLNIPAEMIHYGMTKTAQLAVSRGLAESAAGTGVTVNAVLPGDALGRRGGFLRQDGEGPKRLSGRDGTAVHRGAPTLVGDPAAGDARRSGEHGGLCLLAPGVRQHGCGVARRWRRGAFDRVIRGHVLRSSASAPPVHLNLAITLFLILLPQRDGLSALGH